MSDADNAGNNQRRALGVSEPSGTPRFLADGSARDWELILEQAEVVSLTPGEVIMHAGEHERALYVLTRGAVAGSTPDGRDFKTIAAPSILGELGFIDGGARSLTIRAVSDGEIIRLTYEAFEAIAARDPALGRTILEDLARMVTHRLRIATARLSEGTA